MYTLVSSTNKTVKAEGEVDKTVTSCQMYTLVSSMGTNMWQCLSQWMGWLVNGV
jgi:hypothetical protein